MRKLKEVGWNYEVVGSCAILLSVNFHFHSVGMIKWHQQLGFIYVVTSVTDGLEYVKLSTLILSERKRLCVLCTRLGKIFILFYSHQQTFIQSVRLGC